MSIPSDLETRLVAHQGFLRRIALRLTRDEHLADDLVQRTLLYALENPPSSPGKVRAWLQTVMTRTAMRFLTSERRRWEREAMAARKEAGEEASRGKGDEWLDCEETLVRALRDLPDAYREVVYWHYYENLSHREIAARLNQPLETIRTRMRRARERLRERMSRERGDAVWALALLTLPSWFQRRAPVATTAAPAKLALLAAGAVTLVALPLLLYDRATPSSQASPTTPPALARATSTLDVEGVTPLVERTSVGREAPAPSYR